MNPQTIAFSTLLLAMLSLVSIGLAVGLVVSILTRDRFGLLGAVGPVSIELAAAIAVTATLGSLYLSEIVGYTPCTLCWVQRAFMYPAALLLVAAVVAGSLGRAAWKRRLAGLAGILAVIGIPVSIFHRFEQANLVEGGVCTEGVSCSISYVEEFGFITIPTMAGFGFAGIVALVAGYFWLDRKTPHLRLQR